MSLAKEQVSLHSSGLPPAILVVEDDPGVGKMLVSVLKCVILNRVLLAHDGSHALTMAGEHLIVFLLLDYHLPDMTGLALYDQLHALPGLQNVPALILSASPVAANELKTRGLNMLQKPLSLHDLFEAMESLAPGLISFGVEQSKLKAVVAKTGGRTKRTVRLGQAIQLCLLSIGTVTVRSILHGSLSH